MFVFLCKALNWLLSVLLVIFLDDCRLFKVHSVRMSTFSFTYYMLYGGNNPCRSDYYQLISRY